MPCDLILALDVPTREEAAPILRQLRGQVRWVKLGLQMFTAYGPDYVREVAGMGFDVFLDLKLHDIPNTVAKAVESLGPLPIKMLTLNTSGGGEMMRAATAAQRQTNPNLLLLGVTVLTSTDAAGLNEIGVTASPADQVARLGKLAVASGLRGLVCSPLEVELLRLTLPASIQLVTPGIRAAEAPPNPIPAHLLEIFDKTMQMKKMLRQEFGRDPTPAELATTMSLPVERVQEIMQMAPPPVAQGNDDQKRVMTPADAARAGSSYIVVGRPILKAADPAAAAKAILAELGESKG